MEAERVTEPSQTSVSSSSVKSWDLLPRTRGGGGGGMNSMYKVPEIAPGAEYVKNNGTQLLRARAQGTEKTDTNRKSSKEREGLE